MPVAVRKSKVIKLYQLFGGDHHALSLDSKILMFVQMGSAKASVMSIGKGVEVQIMILSYQMLHVTPFGHLW